jgi:NAD(P)H-nitrite reductase large subunit
MLEDAESLARQSITLIYEPIERVYPTRHEILRKHTIRQSYDRLLLAVGSTPRLVEAAGLHLIGVHQIRIVEDVSWIETWMSELKERGAVVIGGGILGLDMANALRKRGVAVTLVVRESHVGVPFLSESAAHMVEQRMRSDGIHLVLGAEVSAYLSTDDKVLDAVQLTNKDVIATRMALCCVGVSPSTRFLEGVLELDAQTGAILVDDAMRTSAEDVYAAGSCAVFSGVIAQNWEMSLEQGRAAALSMLGQPHAYQPRLFDLATHIYDLSFAYFGSNTSTNVWSIAKDASNFAQVYLEGDCVVGGVFIGEAVSLAPSMWQVCEQRVPFSSVDLAALVV